jgi:hypothetical protein
MFFPYARYIYLLCYLIRKIVIKLTKVLKSVQFHELPRSVNVSKPMRVLGGKGHKISVSFEHDLEYLYHQNLSR